eukprot:scaffold15972_cov66-Phaeocystis_antarctica.AAC.2
MVGRGECEEVKRSSEDGGHTRLAGHRPGAGAAGRIGTVTTPIRHLAPCALAHGGWGWGSLRGIAIGVECRRPI